MTNREKAIEFIQSHKKGIGHPTHSGGLYEMAVSVDDALKAIEIASLSEWIETKEREPEESGLYLGLDENDEVSELFFGNFSKVWMTTEDLGKPSHLRTHIMVTQWMPKPQRPKEKENK